MKKLILILLVMLSIPSAFAAQTGHLTLLTVAEAGEERIGGTADLKLEVKPGSGRIFIDSFPLTKLDTQISTRFANSLACQEMEIDCSEYDFFYTIKAGSTIVGGPSAGAGVGVLTSAVLKDWELDDKTSITGTINSGGIIGPVAGINEKILAAQQKGLNTVIIPKWVSFDQTSWENSTGQNLTIEVKQAGNMEEALELFTGRRIEKPSGEINISDRYSKRMEVVANLLCNRTGNIEEELRKAGEEVPDGENFTLKKETAYNDSRYYTAASYCFSRNVQLRGDLVETMERDERFELLQSITEDVGKLDEEIEKKELQTLSDLETYIIVRERLVDASKTLSDMSLDNPDPETLGYVAERYFSAVAWGNFFGLGGTTFQLDQSYLRDACSKKLSEAEERLDYVSTLSPTTLEDTRRDLDLAYQDQEKGEYALCIFKTGRIKAEADMFLMSITTQMEEIPNIIEEKLEATKGVILEQQERGIFPIMGYSYYEYADSLKDDNTASSLLFSEYSLEMSNLALYFPTQEQKGSSWKNINLDIDSATVFIFLGGLAIGLLAGRYSSQKK